MLKRIILVGEKNLSKQNKGSAYIFVLMIIMISSLVLNLIMSSVNLKFEKNHGENNNLYYMAKYGADIALSILNEIISSCYVIENEKKIVDVGLLDDNIDKYFEMHGANKEINFKLTDVSNEKELIYDLKISFRSSKILKYDINIMSKNSYGNKINLKQSIKYDKENEKFFVEQEEIE